MAPKTSTDLTEFLVLETTVWKALVAGDRAVDSASLHDNFVGLYPTGYASKAEHVDQLADGPTVMEFLLEEARLIPVSDDAALLCYLATYLRTGTGAVTEQMYVSSLWQRDPGGSSEWLNTFSQDTPATGVRLP
jgi:hypothetical protein